MRPKGRVISSYHSTVIIVLYCQTTGPIGFNKRITVYTQCLQYSLYSSQHMKKVPVNLNLHQAAPLLIGCYDSSRMRKAMQHVYLFGPGPFWRSWERSAVVPDPIHDVIHSLETLWAFPTERTDVLSACQCFSKFMTSSTMIISHGRMFFKKEASVREELRLNWGCPLHHSL